jgi:D-alanyl-D-alanine dipeptidase
MAVVIKDNGESLVDIREYCTDFINGLEPARKRKEPKLYLRLSVAKMLGEARKNLPRNLTLVVNDAWRPQSVQKHYWDLYYRKFKKQFPDWNEIQLFNHTKKFVIHYDDAKQAGHLTGAAVDVELGRNGRRLPMKSLKLDFAKRAQTNYPQLQTHINYNRQVLLEIMSGVGFINYPAEYWHFSYGDALWAELTDHQVTKYDIISIP